MARPEELTRKLTIPELVAMKARGERIVMVTAYDAPSARHANDEGIDVVLVGDSAAMTVFGLDGTISATMDEMIMLGRAVVRASTRPVVVGDLPFGSYQVSDQEAVANAIRFMKEAGTDAVKLEGAGRNVSRMRAIVESGMPVMGHLGLTPQSASMLGGFRAQARTAEQASALHADALELEAAGCFAVVLEAVPPVVAARVTQALRIPTIGIGAGSSCDGQILIWHDLLGFTDGHQPRFVKRYAEVGAEIRRGLAAFAEEVRAGVFPSEEHTYSMPADEIALFEADFPRQ